MTAAAAGFSLLLSCLALEVHSGGGGGQCTTTFLEMSTEIPYHIVNIIRIQYCTLLVEFLLCMLYLRNGYANVHSSSLNWYGLCYRLSGFTFHSVSFIREMCGRIK